MIFLLIIFFPLGFILGWFVSFVQECIAEYYKHNEDVGCRQVLAHTGVVVMWLLTMIGGTALYAGLTQ